METKKNDILLKKIKKLIQWKKYLPKMNEYNHEKLDELLN